MGAESLVNRLAYFPQPFAEETTYSIVARCARHLGGMTSRELVQPFVGKHPRRRSVTSLGNLTTLVNMLPATSGLDLASILLKHTALPYYLSVLPEGERQKAFARRMRTSKPAALGARAWRKAASDTVLRFCPLCLPRMISDYSEYYWRRDHQIPAVLVCPEHGVVLRRVNVLDCAEAQVVAATADRCSGTAPPVVKELTEPQRSTLHEIARRLASLLINNHSISAVLDKNQFHAALRAKGLKSGHTRGNSYKFRELMNEHFGHLQDTWQDVIGETIISGSGSLFQLVESTPYVRDPLLCVLTSMLLESLPDARGPFGGGPWSCPNPLVAHNVSLPVTHLEIRHFKLGMILGRFTCLCGYVHTRLEHPDGYITNPKFEMFGETLRPLLTLARVEGWSQRRTAKAAGIPVYTLLAQAQALGLSDICVEHPNTRLRTQRLNTP